MHLFGLFAGVVTLLIIGLGVPLVIYGERFLGYRWWPYMMLMGLLLIGASVFVSMAGLSVVIAVIGATFVWGSTELKEQAVRARLGWFPNNVEKIHPPLEGIIAKWKAPHL
jgi:hypothetical protein